MMKLERKTATSFSEITKQAALSLCVIHGLLPSHVMRVVDEAKLMNDNSGEHGRDLALKKLHDDLAYVEKILFELANELETNHTFASLEKCVLFEKDEQKKKADFIAMFQGQKWKAKHFEKSNRVESLQKDLKSMKQDTQSLIQAKDEEIATLLKAINDAKRLNPTREEYEKKVAKVQIENLQFRLDQEEQRTCTEIATVGREIPQENRVHDALTAFLKESCAKLETRILEWEEKFHTDTVEKREDVAKWEAEVQSKKQDLEEVTQKYEEYWGVVQEYEREQEEERLRKEKEDLHNRAAARIQAWWKGCLVRRGMSAGLKKRNRKSKSPKK